MICNHPMGFLLGPAGTLVCFDCKTPCPGRCVCGAWFRSMQCGNHGHIKGARLA